jgi:hypothetical protein
MMSGMPGLPSAQAVDCRAPRQRLPLLTDRRRVGTRVERHEYFARGSGMHGHDLPDARLMDNRPM